MELTADGLRTVWMAQQRTTEFLPLIGPRGRRVLVATDFLGQGPSFNTTQFVVWRDAQTGHELARTEQPLPAMTTGTMIQPYDFGRSSTWVWMATSSSSPFALLPVRAVERPEADAGAALRGVLGSRMLASNIPTPSVATIPYDATFCRSRSTFTA